MEKTAFWAATSASRRADASFRTNRRRSGLPRARQVLLVDLFKRVEQLLELRLVGSHGLRRTRKLNVSIALYRCHGIGSRAHRRCPTALPSGRWRPFQAGHALREQNCGTGQEKRARSHASIMKRFGSRRWSPLAGSGCR